MFLVCPMLTLFLDCPLFISPSISCSIHYWNSDFNLTTRSPWCSISLVGRIPLQKKSWEEPYDTKCLCDKWPRIYSICRNHNSVLSSFMINTTGVSSGASTDYPSRATEPTHCISWVHVARSLVLCVVFYGFVFDICFSFGHLIVYPSIYGIRLPLWYLYTFWATTWNGRQQMEIYLVF